VSDTKYTGDDLDALNELPMITGYQLLEARIRSELERRRMELERTMDALNTAECRGKIQSLRTVLALPGILRDEIKAELGETKDGR